MKPWLHRIESPVGPILAAADGRGAIVYLGFEEHEPRVALMRNLESLAPNWTRESALLEPLRRELSHYFRGERQEFKLPLALHGTPFRRRVWAELQRIPFGVTISYGELAKRLGDPNLSRAVGSANGMNPVSILVPCHRVIGADGSLTGYAGGLELKRALLTLEARAMGTSGA